MKITAERLRELLHYDPLTGVFTWLVSHGRGGRYPAGSIAGYMHHKGYIDIWLDGRFYRAHRLAWLHVHGAWPEKDIDHRDTVKHHNWIKNLRSATNAQNAQNRPSIRKDGSHVGVTRYKPTGQWLARIMVAGKPIHVGYFEHEADAVAARREAKAVHHPFSIQ